MSERGEGAGWPEVRVDVSASDGEAAIERLEDWLLEAGALSVTLVDRDDADAASGAAVLEPAPGETRLWGEVTVVGLFEQRLTPGWIDALLERAAASANLEPRPSWRHSHLADARWERAWMDDYRPMRFGQRLIVAPHGVEAGGADDVVLRLDPGLAFGTGTHPTTALCLRWLDDNAATLRGATVIDYGAGSGVLAIAALLLGAARAVAVDIDPQAHLASTDNAARNGVGQRLLAGPVSLLERTDAAVPADVLMANILQAPLMQLAERFAELLKPGGRLVMSGLLDGQGEALRVRYTPWFDVAADVTQDGWTRLDAIRRTRDA